MSVSRPSIPSWAFTVRQNVAIVRRRRALFAIVAVALLVGALVGDQLWPKMYTSTADLVTQPAQIVVPGLQASGGSNVSVSELEYMQTQVEIATSLDVLSKLADEEGLVGHDDALKTPTDQLAEFVHSVEIKLHLKTDLGAPQQLALGEAVILLASRVTASVVRDSYVLELKVSTRDPYLSQKIANQLVTEYLNAANQNRVGQLDAAQTVLQQQLTDAKQRVDSAQADLVTYDKKHGYGSQVTTTNSNSHQAGGATITSSTATASAVAYANGRVPLVWSLQVQQDRYKVLLGQLDQAAVEEAAIKGQVSLTGILNQPSLNSQPDGIDRKYRFLIYLLLAPLLAIGATYFAHYLEIYRRTAPKFVAVRQA